MVDEFIDFVFYAISSLSRLGESYRAFALTKFPHAGVALAGKMDRYYRY